MAESSEGDCMSKIISTIFIAYLGWRLTGYDFFSELDDWSEYRLESSVDLAAWDITEKR